MLDIGETHTVGLMQKAFVLDMVTPGMGLARIPQQGQMMMVVQNRVMAGFICRITAELGIDDHHLVPKFMDSTANVSSKASNASRMGFSAEVLDIGRRDT